MLIPFTLISYWGYNEINTKNSVGAGPGYALDIFGVNLFTQFAYSFTNKALWIYWIIPIYAAYKIWGLVSGFCCQRRQSAQEEVDPNEGKSNRQLKKEKAEREGGAK